ncbi:MAG: hypothetical protein AAGH41_14700 [Pseudomonadota bacterium]
MLTPRSGDRVEIDGEAFLIQGEPIRGRERLDRDAEQAHDSVPGLILANWVVGRQ